MEENEDLYLVRLSKVLTGRHKSKYVLFVSTRYMTSFHVAKHTDAVNRLKSTAILCRHSDTRFLTFGTLLNPPQLPISNQVRGGQGRQGTPSDDNELRYVPGEQI